MEGELLTRNTLAAPPPGGRPQISPITIIIIIIPQYHLPCLEPKADSTCGRKSVGQRNIFRTDDPR